MKFVEYVKFFKIMNYLMVLKMDAIIKINKIKFKKPVNYNFISSFKLPVLYPSRSNVT